LIGALREFAQSLLGRGEATITEPSFDGALKPNQALERCETLATLEAPEDIALAGDALLIADGRRLLRWDGAAATLLREFESPITALCGLPENRLAVALNGREIKVFADPAAPSLTATIAGHGMRAVNALCPAGPNQLYASDGSSERDGQDWTSDLMHRGRTGRVLRIDIGTSQVDVLASGLRYAFGVAAMGERAWASESWRHRLVAVGGGAPRVVLTHLPVYPSRLSPAADGGWWMTAFIARTQLVEFVLREKAYRKRMMAEIAPEHWIAPRLGSGGSFFEPMQGAHLKTMGVVKPWAPPRSYGLVVRLDAQGQPLYSLHSRFDGVNHGIVAAVERDGALYLIAKGPKRLLRLPLQGLAQEFSA
jgi:hypothetical protein